MKPVKTLILASGSPRRRKLLAEAGVVFRSRKPFVKEWSPTDFPAIEPTELALTNARKKAEAVHQLYPNQTVLAADTIVVYEKRIFGKPEDMSEARQMLRFLSGRTHEVITAVVGIDSKTWHEHTEISRVTFRKLSDQDIDDYLSQVPVLDKAGAYALQEKGEMLIEWIEGSRENIIGLPIDVVLEWLRSLD